MLPLSQGSPLRKLLLLSLFFLAGWLHAAAIAVVYPEQSVPASERRYAKSLANHLHRWYADAGIETELISDTTLCGPVSYRLAILVDCYAPPEVIVSTVRKRLASGTRFAVCYSASHELAALFGLKIETYRRSATGDWSSMELLANRPAGAPAQILQTSTNIFTVNAASQTVKPMAWWCDRNGKRTNVAWWKTASGSYWMTHILTGDGDESAKQLFLLALAAESVPDIWKTAAQHLYRETIQPLQDGSLQERIKLIPRSSERRQSLDRAYGLITAQQRQTYRKSTENTFAAYQAVCDLRELINRTYGMTFRPRANEVRGVWDHSGQGLFPGDWDRTAKLLANYGITDLYVNVAGAAFALYPSAVLPRLGSEDCLKAAVAACKKHNIRIHAWILAFSGERSTPAVQAAFRQKGWTLQEPDGKDLAWLDPTHPGVQAYLLAAVKEIATRYPVDGIHLDFIRYPGLPQTLGPRIRARFEAKYGLVSNWPEAITDGDSEQRQTFLRWRTAQITDAVQKIHAWMRTNKPTVTLTAAVYGKYPSCVDSVGQDWISWLRTGLIDAALPMNYTESETRLLDWLGTQTADPRLAARIISGIGVTAAESRLTPIQVLHQIEIARKMKCRGFALFDLDENLRTRILPVLLQGVTSP